MGKDIKRRVWEIECNCYDKSGNPIFTPAIVSAFLSHPANQQIFSRWCWTLHDKDVYAPAEQEKSAAQNNGVSTVITGQPKTAHIHLALESHNQIYATALQKCFPGLGIGQIQKPKAKYNQFINICIYQTHEKEDQQAAGKHRYDDSEVHCNFNFREEVNKVLAASAKATGKRMKKAEVDALIEQVGAGEVTIDWIKQNYGLSFYLDYQRKFDAAEQEYIRQHYSIGPRINIYVCPGDVANGGRKGKTQLCKMLARALCPSLPNPKCYHLAGSDKVALQSYRNQPVIIWNDMRAASMLAMLGRSELLNYLEPFPDKVDANIKCSSVLLVNRYNIFNGMEPYDTFISSIAGGYVDRNSGVQFVNEDSSQAYGRFQFVFQVFTDKIDCYINSGWLPDGTDYRHFEQFCRIEANIRQIMGRYDGPALEAQISTLIAPVATKIEELRANMLGNKINDPAHVHPEDVPVVLTPEQAWEQDLSDYEQAAADRAAEEYDARFGTPPEPDWQSIDVYAEYQARKELGEPVTFYYSSHNSVLAFSHGMFSNHKYEPLEWTDPSLPCEEREQLKQKQLQFLETWLAEEEELRQQYAQKLAVQAQPMTQIRYTGADRQY